MRQPIDMPPAVMGQEFGGHLADYSQFGLIGHNGIDYPAPKGTLIYAVADGYIVEQTSKETGYGLRITQRIFYKGKHYLLVYGHMERLENPVDVPYDWNLKSYPVQEGQVIGYVDSTGFSTGHHLHFGAYEYTESGIKLNINNGYQGAINPELLFKDHSMIVYKKTADATLYFACGNVLIPFATDYASFLKDFAQAVILELPDSEFLKFKVSELKVKK